MPQCLIVTGNVAADAEVRFTPTGKKVATFRVASNESYTDKNGDRKEVAEWFSVEVWGDKASDIHKQYTKKGSTLWLIGKLRTRKSGEGDTAKYYTSYVVDEFRYVGARKDAQPESGQAEAAPAEEHAPVGDAVPA